MSAQGSQLRGSTGHLQRPKNGRSTHRFADETEARFDLCPDRRGEVRPFLQIAYPASQSQVAEFRLPAMLSGDDVLDVEGASKRCFEGCGSTRTGCRLEAGHCARVRSLAIGSRAAALWTANRLGGRQRSRMFQLCLIVAAQLALVCAPIEFFNARRIVLRKV